MYLQTVEGRIDRLEARRTAELRIPSGATDAAAIATRVAYIDGKLDALKQVWEDSTGRTYDRPPSPPTRARSVPTGAASTSTTTARVASEPADASSPSLTPP